MTKKRRFSTKVCVGLILVLLWLLGLAIWGVWQLVSIYVSPTWTRIWALIATALIPVAGWACFNLGLTENRGRLAGIDAGIDRVVKSAAAAIDLRATSTRKMRQAQQDPPVLLPPLPAPRPASRASRPNMIQALM